MRTNLTDSNNDKKYIQVVSMNLSPILEHLDILNESTLIYHHPEGEISRIWEIWDIEEIAWEALDTLSRYEENQYAFKYDAWWYTPKLDMKKSFISKINLLLGKPHYKVNILNCEIIGWTYKNKKKTYYSLLDYFHEELDEWNSENIIQMCMVLAIVNKMTLIDLFKNLQNNNN